MKQFVGTRAPEGHIYTYLFVYMLMTLLLYREPSCVVLAQTADSRRLIL